MSLSDLDHTDKRVLMFGGKGGVGKTTCAAATALHFASLGRRTLVISSDATPSLSDIFEITLGPTETHVDGLENLLALEVSVGEVMRRWKEKFGPEVYDAASALVDLDYDELIDYVALAPGIQQEFMLDYILERVRDRQYDLVVWDTAPAGDTLRLLGLPYQFLAHLRIAPRAYLGLRDALQLRQAPFLKLIESWQALAGEVIAFMRDPAKTEFLLVTIPEALGVHQTRRIIVDLAHHGLEVRHIIINDVIMAPDGEFLRHRMEMQRPYVDMLTADCQDGVTLTQLPLLAQEVKGLDSLRMVERLLFAG